ncbi:MAG TPA: hypothetical protein VE684_15660 [Crenalkalicoccus sp.]|jgi:hypothetical protein|nr:hypothetical protein [Crenalkalicoccus sp.]
MVPDSPLQVGLVGTVWLLAVLAWARAAGLSLRDEVAPVGAAFSLLLALVLYLSKERSERRRKTLEACETQFLDADLRDAVYALRLKVAQGEYSEGVAPDGESDISRTTLVLNYCETCCAGAAHGLYDAGLMREFLGPLATFMIGSFLVAPRGGELPTRLFLATAPVPAEVPEEASVPFANLRALFPEVFAAAAARHSPYLPAPRLR